MHILLVIVLLFLLPLLGFIVYLALSSCLGDSLRRSPRHSSSQHPSSRSSTTTPFFGSHYLRGSSSSGLGIGAWEGIEMAGIVREGGGVGGEGGEEGEEGDW